MRKLGTGVVGIMVAGFFAIACGTADPYGDGPKTDTNKVDPKGGAGACAKPIEGKDPSTLPECTGTKGVKGRCVPRTELGTFKDTFEKASCADETLACVPDDLVKNGTKIELKKCTGVLESEGRCFWPLAKDIIANYDLLKGATKDQCPADQVCAPCVNPLDKKETGVCSTGAAAAGDASCDKASTAGGAPAGAGGGGTCPQIEPNLDTKSFAVDNCGSNMLCVDKALVGAQADKLKTCSKGVCAPKKSVERGGNYVPLSCRSAGGVEGRCLNMGIPMIGEQKDQLPQEKCDADERCAPCFDPRDGTETGACKSASCDAPKEPAKTFPQCCGGRARCVPTSAVPADSQGNLGPDTCTGDTPLCAPNELIGIPGVVAKQCKAGFGLITGICVSKCAIDSIANFIQGDCADDEMCAPCSQLPPGTSGCAN